MSPKCQEEGNGGIAANIRLSGVKKRLHRKRRREEWGSSMCPVWLLKKICGGTGVVRKRKGETRWLGLGGSGRVLFHIYGDRGNVGIKEGKVPPLIGNTRRRIISDTHSEMGGKPVAEKVADVKALRDWVASATLARKMESGS